MASFLLNLDTHLLISARELVGGEYASIVQLLGEFIVIWGMIVLVGLWIWGVFQKNETHKKDALRIFFLILLIFIIYSIINLGVPQWRESPQIVAGGIKPLIPHPIDNSFPSGHAIFGTTLCMGIWIFVKNRILLVSSVIITIITGISRVIGGVHYPGDIIGGILIASIGSYLLFPIVLSKAFEGYIYPLCIKIARVCKL